MSKISFKLFVHSRGCLIVLGSVSFTMDSYVNVVKNKKCVPISFGCDRPRMKAYLDPSLVVKMTVLTGVSWGQASKLNG